MIVFRAANQSVLHVHVDIVQRWRVDLWRLGLQLIKRPLVPRLGAVPRSVLDWQADLISAQLEPLE